MLHQENTSQKPSNQSRLFMREASPLVEMAADFSRLTRPNSKEITKFRDMFYVLVLRANKAERKKIAEALAPCFYTPRPVAIYLGMEDVDISAPVLLFSPVFTPYDLNKIVEKYPVHQASVIARRNDLDISTIRLLLSVDNENETLTALLRKNSSLHDRSNVVELIKSQANHQPAKNSAIEHQDKAAHASVEANPTHSKPVDLSGELLALSRLGKPKSIAPSPEAVAIAPVRKPAIAVKEHQPQTETVHTQNTTSVSSQTDTMFNVRLLDLARVHDLDRMAEIAAERLSIRQEQALTIFSGDNAGMQASALCALGFGKISASKVLLLINNTIGRNANIFKIVMEKYDGLNQSECLEFFENIDKKHTAPLKHLGSFSAAIAARRRDIVTAQAPQTPRANKIFGKLTRAS